MNAAFLIGRAVFGGYFVYNGINHFRHLKHMAQYAGAKNVPVPEAAVAATGAMMVIGGTSIILGFKPKLGAAAVIGFLAGVSPVMHDFWKAEDPQQRMADMINFTKNTALLGAALAFLGVEEPWPASVCAAQPSRVERLRTYARRRMAA